MQGTSDFSVFPRIMVCFAVLPFLIICCRGGELSSESDPFFNFLRAVDPKNVLNISSVIGSPSHPCLVNLNNGVKRCNSNATNVVEIRLENLNLSGTIDANSLCRLQMLRVVSLAKNNIRGTIPHSILHCTRLMYLNLSGNKLSGRVPKALTKLKYLHNLDISNNNFNGMIPRKQEYRRLSTYHVTPTKLESNSAKVWRKDGDTNSTDGASSGNSKKSNGSMYSLAKTWLPIILGIVGFVAALYFAVKKYPKVCIEGIKALKSRQVSPVKKATSTTSREAQEEVKPKGGDSSGLVFFVGEDERFTLEDLLRATADLRSDSFCSSLYKVKLENDVYYAVKRLKNVQVSSEEFGEILRQIGKLKHPNVLPLVGYRSTNEEKLVIYKYQSNGSLLNLLNGKFKIFSKVAIHNFLCVPKHVCSISIFLP